MIDTIRQSTREQRIGSGQLAKIIHVSFKTTKAHVDKPQFAYADNFLLLQSENYVRFAVYLR